MNNQATILAKTIYGEARGEPDDGKRAVANVIMNRVRKGGWWGDTVDDVCLKPWQFSCWNKNDPNRSKLDELDENDQTYATCMNIALDAISGLLVDNTRGATHYHVKGLHPPWAAGKTPCATIGHHLFYNDVR